MKIIFLDIDGVLNIPPYDKFNEECLSNLYRILDSTGAEIIVSSSWRCGDLERTKGSFIKNGFSEKYINRITAETCRGYKQIIKGSQLPIVRGNEIKAFVDTQLKYPWHGNPSKKAEYEVLEEDGRFKTMRCNKVGVDYSYVIIDDDTDMLLEQAKWFINTNGETGLTLEDSEKATKKLNSIDKVERSVATTDSQS